MSDLTDRVILCAGSTGALGPYVVAALARAGARLVLPDRAPGRLAGRFPDLAQRAAHWLAEGFDAGDPAAAERLVREATGRFGRLDGLVSTVGAWEGGLPVHATSLETWDRLMVANARVAFTLARAVLPGMVDQQRGKLVFVGAREAIEPRPNNVAYSASKGALRALVEVLSVEYRPHNINVNAVLPASIYAPAVAESDPEGDPDKYVQPDAIADLITFLVSDAARAVHGALIPAYGRLS